MDIRLPHNYVLPKSVLDATRRTHPAPPPVYKHLMDDLMLGVMAPDAGDVAFTVPPYVVGFPLYDAENVARWMFGVLDEAGYAPSLRESEPRRGMDMWPDRHERKPGFIPFTYDEDEYVRALEAPAWTVLVPA